MGRDLKQHAINIAYILFWVLVLVGLVKLGMAACSVMLAEPPQSEVNEERGRR